MHANSSLSDSLKQLNPLLSNNNGIHQNTSTKIRSSGLSHYIHLAVDHLYDTVSDLSLFSIELEEQLQTFELREAISPAPYNFLLAFELNKLERVLDLSQDFGGVSHYLASHVKHVDSVKIDLGKATLSAKRCAEFNNITFISEVLTELVFADNSYDLIIIGQLEELELDKQQQSALIKALELSLKNTGRLVVNAQNQTKINKWTSAGKKHSDFSHLYYDHTERFFTQSELEHSLKTAGFLYWKAYASFSLNKNISNLFSQSYLSQNSNSINHFNRLGSLGNEKINEYLAIKNINKERGTIFDLASRFIFIASASELRSKQLCNLNFAHFSGTSRKPRWRTTTVCETDSNKVLKLPLHPSYSDMQDQNAILTQCTNEQEFKSGELLLDQWLSAIVSDEPTSNLEPLISQYAQWLHDLENTGKLNGKAYDILPFNIIVDHHDNEFNIIDPEWDISAKFNSSFILFRALFWFAFENKNLLKTLAKDTGLVTIGLFVLHYLSRNANQQGEPSKYNSINDLKSFVELEELIQREISSEFRSRSVENALLQTFDGEPLAERLQPACQISWGDTKQNFDESNSVFIQWRASTEQQHLRSDTPSFDEDKGVLRIDPIASLGFFKLESIVLSNNKGEIVWQATSSQKIDAQAELKNISYSKDTGHFIATNEDPHFLINLDQLENRSTVTTVSLSLSLIHNEYYDASLSTLSNALIEQNAALSGQTSSLESKRAEIASLKAKIDNIDQHRQGLQQSVHNTQVALNKAQQAHQQHIHTLTIELQTQASRIHEFESVALARHYVRAKRIAKRIIKKLIGRA